MKLTRLKTAALAAGIATMMTSTALAADVKATMIIYLDPSVQFFNPVVKGAKDAAAQFGVDLDVQYANNDPVRQNDLIESATAAGVDGIAVSISSSDAFDESICAAVKAGIVVIGFNNDDLEGAKGNCRQAYVGMNEFASGYELGNRMIKEFGLKSGDVVFNPREIPEASFAVARGGGIEKAMKENGIKVETVRAGLDPAEAQNIMAQFLIANPNVKAVFGTGSVTSTVGAGAIKDAGVKVPFGGFDLAVEIVNAVESGAMFATMDQQPYLQGYYPIAQIALSKKYGLTPTDVDTGQGAFLDKSRISSVKPLIGSFR
ncbi:substrate-binding domain-containing protein (plasmid) [Rhizobium grahamii]|uniref:Substrate-binding domain-containing protein n=1 Tax=Rhizobium grahamii TaxID=1120045 RepID=A0A5Q0CG55_9HYPH|nr:MULTISPECIES: substrate-binding domain-containing protein [Rhizobium]QFY63160.1 substrate-binding domain-containing protein [Rhizobium grahamii]QRM52078.1 substrate-binding domain-containing protein [Rhizobium sp. BG6]